MNFVTQFWPTERTRVVPRFLRRRSAISRTIECHDWHLRKSYLPVCLYKKSYFPSRVSEDRAMPPKSIKTPQMLYVCFLFFSFFILDISVRNALLYLKEPGR